MDSKIPPENSNQTSAVPPDHNLPMQGEFAKENEEGVETQSLMEAVQLEIDIEKSKIREEIIASEIIRKRQELEEEVRLKHLMEKKLMGMNMRRFHRSDSSVIDPCLLVNDSGFSGGSYLNKNLINVGNSEDEFAKNLQFVNHHQQQIDPELHVNDNVFGSGKKEQVNHDDLALGNWPSEGDSSLVGAGKSMAEFGQEVVLDQVMPNSSISGMKRKAEASASDEETVSVESKDLQKKWYCSLCDVSATSAGGLNLHLHGKKHKVKEAMSKCDDNVSSISTDCYSTENSMRTEEQMEGLAQPMEVEKNQGQPTEDEKSQVSKKWECSLCQISATSEVLLRSHLQGKKHKAKEARAGIGQGMSETVNGKSEAVNKWYCSLCEVSAPSEKNLSDHFKGKKHKAKAGLLHEEADDVQSKSTGEDMKMVEEKNLEGKGPENEQETKDASTESSKGQVFKQKIVNTTNIVKAGSERDTSNIEGDKQETSYRELVKFWHCKMCNEGTYDETIMADHRKSSKHMDMLRKTGGGLIVVSNKLKEH